MAKTYTKHKLTDAMLRHLSATHHGRQVGGMSMRALESRDLIFQATISDAPGLRWYTTMAGRLALINARKEGW